MRESDADLVSGLPQPLARAWSAVLGAGDAAASLTALDAFERELATLFGLVRAAAATAGEAALAAWAQASLDGLTPPADPAEPAEERRRRLRAVAAGLLEASAPRLVALAGPWAVRLAGPSAALGSAPEAGQPFQLAWATPTRVVGVGALGVYDPEQDEVRWGGPGPDAPPRPAAADDAHAPGPAVLRGTAGPGERFASFRLLRAVKAGGQGVLYEAEQDQPRRIVALKVLHAHLMADETAVRRMRAEAQTLAGIDHRHVVQVFDAGVWQGQPWLAMRFVRGPSLNDVLDALSARPAERTSEAAWLEAVLRRPPSTARSERGSHWRRVAEMGRDVARALHACHRAHLVHRDVKPANLLFDPDGSVVLTDFGLARSATSPTLTESNQLVGTPQYVAPETLRPSGTRDVEPRTDVYGLGATLYEALALRRPFADAEGDPVALFRAILTQAPRRLGEVAPAVPRDLDTIVMKCLEKEPAGRYGSAAELADDLDRLLRHEPIRARPPGWGRRALHGVRRHPAVGVVVGTLLLLAAVLLVQGLRQRRLARESRLQGEAEAVARERERRLEGVRSTLHGMSHVQSASPIPYLDGLFELIRHADADTVAVIARALDAVTTAQRQVNEGLPDGGDAATRTRRAHEAQARTIPGTSYRVALTCAEVLGRIGIVPGAVEALERHLGSARAPEALREAGVALARLSRQPGGERALEALERAAQLPHVGIDPAWGRTVRAHLTHPLSGLAPAIPDALLPPPPRRPHGTLRDERPGAELLVPVIVESWMGLGMPQDNRFGRSDDASLARRLTLEGAPRADAWRDLGQVLARQGDLVDACSALTHAVELAPDEPDAWHERAACRRLLGEFAGALRDLAVARRLAPQEAWPAILEGLVWSDAGEPAHGLELLDRAVERHPERALAHSYRSMALIMLGDGAGAERSALRATELEARSAEHWNCVACARLLQGDLAGALAAARESVANGPGYTLGRTTLGALQHLVGESAAAEASLRAALASGAALPFAWNDLGVVLLARGDAAGARAHFAAALQICPRLPSPWLGYARASAALGDAEAERDAAAIHARLSAGPGQTPRGGPR